MKLVNWKNLVLGGLILMSITAAEAKPAKKAKAESKDAELFSETLKNDKRFAGVFPANVKTIACISPASYPGSPSHRRGVELLKKAGYNVKVMPHAFEPAERGGTGAPLKDRLEDFYAAWNDPEVDMILCVRGGRGCRDLLANLDWKKLKPRKELYLQGYSDVTQITAAMLAKGYGIPVAGPMAGSMSGLDAKFIGMMKAMHNGEQVGPIKVEPIIPGDASGLPLAGLLSRLAWVVESDYCPSAKDRIVIIEVVSSTPAKVREDLQLLLDRKFFAGAKAVVFGHFLRSGSPEELQAIQKEFAPKFGVPVYRGFPFGHARTCVAIDFTRPVEIKNDQVIFPAVKAE
ncbi:MAG: LD-carboxypeptidase [Lentisphaeria bacterium]|nr:LD-carboxypeptidase [Lentisphaeria bacterium]